MVLQNNNDTTFHKNHKPKLLKNLSSKDKEDIKYDKLLSIEGTPSFYYGNHQNDYKSTNSNLNNSNDNIVNSSNNKGSKDRDDGMSYSNTNSVRQPNSGYIIGDYDENVDQINDTYHSRGKSINQGALLKKNRDKNGNESNTQNIVDDSRTTSNYKNQEGRRNDREETEKHVRIMDSNPDTKLIDRTVSPNYHYHRQRAGVYGWRKRCLYFWVLTLGLLSLLNLALTIWMLRLLRFNWRGMGTMKFTRDNIILNGNTVFNQPLRVANLQAPNGNLNLISDRSVVMQAFDNNTNISNSLYIGPNGIISQGPKFEVKNKFGHTVFAVTPDNMTIKLNTLNVNSKNGGRFKTSVQTPLIRSPPSESLKLESLTRTLELESNGIDMKALAGPINVLSLQDITLNSQEGKINLAGGRIYFPNLPKLNSGNNDIENPRNLNNDNIVNQGEEHYKGVFQLCICENGRLFLTLPDSNCKGTFKICDKIV